VGGRYSDEWHRVHLNNPRDVVPESNMPGYPWLAKSTIDPQGVAPKMKALSLVGVPYTAADIAGAEKDVAGKNEQDALIAYLQVMGTSVKAGGAAKAEIQAPARAQASDAAAQPKVSAVVAPAVK
jgi:cytochrome c oxidase cbb3-type subunit 2